MRQIIFALMCAIFASCSNSNSEKTKTVDTTIIGSDNPAPVIDTSGMNKLDSPGK